MNILFITYNLFNEIIDNFLKYLKEGIQLKDLCDILGTDNNITDLSKFLSENENESTAITEKFIKNNLIKRNPGFKSQYGNNIDDLRSVKLFLLNQVENGYLNTKSYSFKKDNISTSSEDKSDPDKIQDEVQTVATDILFYDYERYSKNNNNYAFNNLTKYKNMLGIKSFENFYKIFSSEYQFLLQHYSTNNKKNIQKVLVQYNTRQVLEQSKRTIIIRAKKQAISTAYKTEVTKFPDEVIALNKLLKLKSTLNSELESTTNSEENEVDEIMHFMEDRTGGLQVELISEPVNENRDKQNTKNKNRHKVESTSEYESSFDDKSKTSTSDNDSSANSYSP